mmetsp:Transcript_6567/g.27299  ORF Transcript_6567/g.27299 Transcript_6567/m.27299 type:complete len:279 (+) Transcript_6567:1002-1838(+)
MRPRSPSLVTLTPRRRHPRVIRLPRQPRAASCRDAPHVRGGYGVGGADRSVDARYPQRLVSVGRLLADPRGGLRVLDPVAEGQVRLDVEHGRAVDEVGSGERQGPRAGVRRDHAAEAQADGQRPVRRARRERAHRFAVQPRDADLRLDRAAVPCVPIVGVGVEDVDDPDVGVLVHGREEISGQSGREGEYAPRARHEIPALPRGPVAPGEARVDLRDRRTELLDRDDRSRLDPRARLGRRRFGAGELRRHRRRSDGGRGVTGDAGAVRLAHSQRPAHV